MPLTAPAASPDVTPSVTVVKRDGSREEVKFDKILLSIKRACAGLAHVDPIELAKKAIDSVHDGITTRQLDELSMRAAADKVGYEPNYSKVAARILSEIIAKEVGRDATLFQVSERLLAGGYITKKHHQFIKKNRKALEAVIDHGQDGHFEFFGMATVYDRYLLKNPESGQRLERPQHFLMRVAIAKSDTAEEAIAFYQAYSSLNDYIPATPTLFNAGTPRPQMSSCYLQSNVPDDLDGIYGHFHDAASLSKWAGGIGTPWHLVRPAGEVINGTKGLSNGIVPFLKVKDSSVLAVNQGGKRKGASAEYLTAFHPDMPEFLECRDQTGDIDRRTFNLNLACWVPDIFMRRVEEGGMWRFFSPNVVPALYETFDDGVENQLTAAYLAAEAAGLYTREMPAQELYARMMKTLTETGNGWMCFSDTCNRNHPQVKLALAGTVPAVHKVVDSSNLCTEILELRDTDETAVCNLASVILRGVVVPGTQYTEGLKPEDLVDVAKLKRTVALAVTDLDRVIDRNYYPTEGAKKSNMKWRPIGLGVMGFHEMLQILRVPFEHPMALELSAFVQRIIWEQAVETSTELGGGTQKNSLLIAIAPTATIASIVGTTECTEPSVSNLFRRETLTGDFVQINAYLVRDLQARGLWGPAALQHLRDNRGSVATMDIPDDLKALYKTAWEIPAKTLIDLQAARNPYIDQSASLNLFMENPNIGKASKMYMYAWKKGIKTTYYLRSRAASTTASVGASKPGPVTFAPIDEPAAVPTGLSREDATAEDAVACSLANPESCEACQ